MCEGEGWLNGKPSIVGRGISKSVERIEDETDSWHLERQRDQKQDLFRPKQVLPILLHFKRRTRPAIGFSAVEEQALRSITLRSNSRFYLLKVGKLAFFI